MEKNRIEVTGIGTLAVDYFAVVPKLIGAEEKIISSRLEVHAGGVSGNVLTQVARLGARAGWLGKVGDDDAGRILLDEFGKEGIDGSHAEVVPGGFSMITWIQVDARGERSIVMFPNVLGTLTPEEVEKKHGAYIAASSVLHTEACLLPLKPVIRAMEIARENGVRVVFDLDVPPSDFIGSMKLATEEELSRALQLADVLIPCKGAASELLETDDIVGNAKKLLDFGPRTVAITLGDRGCIVINEDEFVEIPAFKVKVVDTTGAGDAFHGGFIYGMLRGWDLERIGTLANGCGALCCTELGARSMGRMEDVQKLIDSGS